MIEIVSVQAQRTVNLHLANYLNNIILIIKLIQGKVELICAKDYNVVKEGKHPI